jgi:putative redox protein
MEVTAHWKSALAFEAVSDNGHRIAVDTTVAGGGLDSGMSPKKLLLAGICACSGMDVVDILNKMKVPFQLLVVSAAAEQTDEHPKVFRSIEMVYQSDVAAENLDKFHRAIQLSQEKYCGVSAMLAKACPVTYVVQSI